MWSALIDEVPVTGAADDPVPGSASALQRAHTVLFTERGRAWISLAPIVAVFAVTEWLLVIGKSSFAGPIDFIGVIAVSIMAGIYPILLLVASRRKGEYVPGLVFRILGYPPVAVAIYLLFLTNLIAHALVIWENPLERVFAWVVAALIVAVTVVVIRRGSFRRRTVVELRAEPAESGGAILSVVASGAPLTADLVLEYASGKRSHHSAAETIPYLDELRSALVELPVHEAAELEIWAHRITEAGDSEPIAGQVQVHQGEEVRQYDLQLSGGRVFVPVPDGRCAVTFLMPAPTEMEPAQASRRTRTVEGI
jgi:hypothetical protein